MNNMWTSDCIQTHFALSIFSWYFIQSYQVHDTRLQEVYIFYILSPYILSHILFSMLLNRNVFSRDSILSKFNFIFRLTIEWKANFCIACTSKNLAIHLFCDCWGRTNVMQKYVDICLLNITKEIHIYSSRLTVYPY